MDLDTILFFIGAVIAVIILIPLGARMKNAPRKKRQKMLRILLYVYVLIMLSAPILHFFTYGNWTEVLKHTKETFSMFGYSIIFFLAFFAYGYFRKGDAEEDEE